MVASATERSMAQSSGSTRLGAIPAFTSTRIARLASGIDGRCNPEASYVSLYLWTILDLGSDSASGDSIPTSKEIHNFEQGDV